MVIREFCLIQSSSMLGCISAFVEDKNKETFHFNSLLMFQQTIQSITVIHTVAEKTGHKSLGGLRAYERTTLDQEQAAASILGSSEATYNQKPMILKSVCDKSHSFEEIAACEQDSVNDKPANDQKKFPFFSGSLQNCTFNFY